MSLVHSFMQSFRHILIFLVMSIVHVIHTVFFLHSLSQYNFIIPLSLNLAHSLNSFIHSFVHSFCQPVIHSFIRVIQSPIYTRVSSLSHLVIHSVMRSFSHSTIQSFIHSFPHPVIHLVTHLYPNCRCKHVCDVLFFSSGGVLVQSMDNCQTP